MPRLERDGEVFVLHLDTDDENRFHPDWLSAVEAALDEVESVDGPHAMVTLGHGKFFSNGLDLAWLSEHPDQEAPYLDRVHRLLSRTLAAATVTVAAINGHAFAGGALWTLAHDMRIMRSDRGWFCLPEVDIGKAFTPGMAALVSARLTPQVAHEAMTTGRRYGGDVAAELGIVDATAGADDLADAARSMVAPLASKAAPVRAEIKRIAYAGTLASLDAPVPT